MPAIIRFRFARSVTNSGYRLLPPSQAAPLAPVCIAIALRSGTVAVNDPPETVTLPNPKVQQLPNNKRHLPSTLTLSAHTPSTNNITIFTIWELRLEGRIPVPVRIVDSDKASISSPERNLLRLWRSPVCYRSVAYVVSESDHSRDGCPAVLAEPAVASPTT